MKCPICGQEDTLSVCVLTQNARHYRILKDGRKSKKCELDKDMYLDEGFLLLCDNGCSLDSVCWEILDGKLVID